MTEFGGRITAGEKARSAYTQKGEHFVGNIDSDGVTLQGKRMTVEEFLEYKMSEGKYKSVRVEEHAFDINGRPTESAVAIMVILKEEPESRGNKSIDNFKNKIPEIHIECFNEESIKNACKLIK
jgi:hypothetical protein